VTKFSRLLHSIWRIFDAVFFEFGAGSRRIVSPSTVPFRFVDYVRENRGGGKFLATQSTCPFLERLSRLPNVHGSSSPGKCRATKCPARLPRSGVFCGYGRLALTQQTRQSVDRARRASLLEIRGPWAGPAIETFGPVNVAVGRCASLGPFFSLVYV